MFDNMRMAALKRLDNRDPIEIARNAGVDFDGEAFRFSTLGKAVEVSYPQFLIFPPLPEWQEMTVLHYLDLADGIMLSAKQMTFSQDKEGMVRGGGFDRDVEKIVAQKLGKLSPEELEHRCRSIGGVTESSNADLCIRFDYLPRYPVWLKIWFADEEYPASGRMLVDQIAQCYLTIEDAVTVGTLILDLLTDSEQWS